MTASSTIPLPVVVVTGARQTGKTVVAHIGHRHTNYDELLMSGYARSEARAEIHGELDREYGYS